MSDEGKNNEAVCNIVNQIVRMCEDIRDCLGCCSCAGAVRSIYECQIDRIKTDFNCIMKLTGDARRYLPTENQYPN